MIEKKFIKQEFDEMLCDMFFARRGGLILHNRLKHYFFILSGKEKIVVFKFPNGKFKSIWWMPRLKETMKDVA